MNKAYMNLLTIASERDDYVITRVRNVAGDPEIYLGYLFGCTTECVELSLFARNWVAIRGVKLNLADNLPYVLGEMLNDLSLQMTDAVLLRDRIKAPKSESSHEG